MRTVGVGEKDEISFENPGDYELITMNLIGPNIQNSSGAGVNKIYGIQLIYTNFSIYEDFYSN